MSARASGGKLALALRSPRAEWVMLGLMALALVLRLPGVRWGLPHIYHPDEPTHVGIVLNILKSGDLNPHWFKYPSFRIYISLPVAIVYFLLGVSRGQFASVQELQAASMLTCGTGTTTIPGLYAGLRLLMTLFGVLGVGFVYWWGSRHWDRRVGLLAALVLALSPLDVMVGHWYRPDTILTLFSGAAVLAAALLLRRDDYKHYLLAGALSGLAASVKYNAAVLQFVPIVLAHFLARRRLLDWRLWITPLAAGIVFLLITPYALLDLPAFLDGFAFEINHYYVRGHAGSDAAGFGSNLIWYLGKLLRYGGPLSVLALCAPFLVSISRRKETWLLLSWPLMVLLLNATARARTVLALVPATVVLAVLSAVALDRLLLKLTLPIRNMARRRWAMVAITALLLIWPTWRLAQVDAAFAQPDLRTVTQIWIEENLPADARVMAESYGPVLGEGGRYCATLADRSPEWYQAAGYDYLVAGHYWTFYVAPELHAERVAAYERLFAFPEVARLEGPLQYLYDPMHEMRVLQVPVPSQYSLLTDDGDAPWLVEGFHGLESADGRPFRWIGERATVQVRLMGGHQYRLRLQAVDGRPEEADVAHSVLYLGDQLLAERDWSRQSEVWELTFDAPGALDEVVTQSLTLVTNPWQPSAYGGADERLLGVRVQAIELLDEGVATP